MAGGGSRRMGADKATLEIDGRSLLDTALDALEAAGAEPIVVVGGSTKRATPVADEWPGEGPLGGLIVGLDAVADAADAAVVLACDLPRIDPGTVSELATRLGAEGADVAIPVVDGRRQPLSAAYRTDTRDQLRRAFEAGERSLQKGLAVLEVTELSDLSPHAFADLDTPEDVSALRRQP